MKKHNYSAGPCILPQEVFEKSAQAILNFNNSDLSLLEISHRSKDFVAVMEEARALVLELLGLENDAEQIQCIVSKDLISDSITFGQTQKPNLWNYADNVDTLAFLQQIRLHFSQKLL